MGYAEKKGGCEMEMEELRKVLDLHEKWVRKESGGIRANLQGADLQGADLRDAYLRDADLQGEDLQGAALQGADLRGADLRGAALRDADLRGAALRGADLRGAALRGVDLQGADLQGADLRDAALQGADLRDAALRDAALRGADLRDADIDYAVWPLWCGSLEAYIDDRIAIQLLYHLLRPVQASPYVSQEVKDKLLTYDLIDLANRFHRAEECGEIKR